MYEIQTYLGADGLMHCTVCKEPVEAFYPKGSFSPLPDLFSHFHQTAPDMPLWQAAALPLQARSFPYL